jgi:c-di-GMP-binding flagellar brake protein YcgR
MMEKRAFVRVRASDRHEISVTRLEGYRETEDIRVENISEGGLCLTFSTNPNYLFFQEFIDLDLDLGAGGILNIRVQPRYIQLGENDRYRLGLEFIHLSGTNHSTIKKYIDACIREDNKNNS